MRGVVSGVDRDVPNGKVYDVIDDAAYPIGSDKVCDAASDAIEDAFYDVAKATSRATICNVVRDAVCDAACVDVYGGDGANR